MVVPKYHSQFLTCLSKIIQIYKKRAHLLYLRCAYFIFILESALISHTWHLTNWCLYLSQEIVE
ncbi:hypothetical protein D3C72_487150 [compost metagenome]